MDDGFVWKGMHSASYGLICESLPNISVPERRVEKVELNSRNGYYTIDHQTYSGDVKSVSFHLTNEKNIDVVKSWLSGSGKVTFSSQPDRYYKAVIISKVDLEQVIPTLHKGLVQFDCQPFGYLHDGKIPLILTQSVSTVINTGNYPSEPYIKLICDGDIVLRVNGTPLSIKDVSGYVEIDADLDKIYKGTESMENKASGDTPIFETGVNTIEWTGNITRVEITPRWRCL